MKKVLIITYYWPPSGGAGVQRWMRFVKHLREFGWEPIVYAPKDAVYSEYDEKLANELPAGLQEIRLKVREPNNLIAKLTFWKKDKNAVIYDVQATKEKKSALQRLLWYVRANFFIPDARSLWIKPSVRYLSKQWTDIDADLIVSTGPPHSMHLIGRALHEKFGTRWLADFRDPWTTMEFYNELPLGARGESKHQRLEKSVITGADQVVVVGNAMRNEFKERFGVQAEVIYNGYNEKGESVQAQLDEKFTITHTGSFRKGRNCPDLWQALAELTAEDEAFAKDLEIKLVGNVAPEVKGAINDAGLSAFLNAIPYVPYDEAQVMMHAAQVLLLPIDRLPNAEHVLTGKLFEYLKAGRPVLLLGPTHGDAAAVVAECKAGLSCDFDDVAAIKRSVRELYDAYKSGDTLFKPVNVERFSGYELTRQMAGIFDQVTS